MFHFRLLLLGFVGLLGSSESYFPGYPAYPQADPYSTYYQNPGYSSPRAAYAYQTPPAYGPLTRPPYQNCSTMRVNEVLDHIFCEHSDYQRYSSKYYRIIDESIDQLTWIMHIIYLEDVRGTLRAAITNLQALNDETYSLYGESSLLQHYDEQGGKKTAEGGSQTEEGSLKEKLALVKATLDAFEANAKTAVNQHGLIPAAHVVEIDLEKEVVEEAVIGNILESNAELEEQEVDKAELMHQFEKFLASGGQEQTEGDTIQVIVTEQEVKPAFSHQHQFFKQKRKTPASARGAVVRKTRDVDATDYTCALLHPIICSEDQYDDLLYNIIDHLITSLNLLTITVNTLWEYMQLLDCTDPNQYWQLVNGAFAYGSIATSYYSLQEVIEDVFRVYKILELEGGVDGRAQMTQMGMGNRRPMMMAAPNKSPLPMGFPFGFFGSQQQTQTSATTYPLQQQQFRVQRHAPSTMPTSVMHTAPAILLVG